MNNTKLLYFLVSIIYIAFCFINLFLIDSKILKLLVYSPLIFINLIVWSIFIKIAIEMYKTNKYDSKII